MLPDLSDALLRWAPRLRCNGIDPADLDRARSRAGSSWEAWFAAMVALGGEHAALAAAALERGHRLSAGEAWVRAGLCYHFAQFALFDWPEQRAQGHGLKLAAFAAAAPLLQPPIERLEVPYGQDRLPVLLRRPAGPGPHPWVLLVPGLDSTKEEFHTFAELLLARGLAAAAFDGPGQGELAMAGRPWRPGDEAAAPAVLEALRGVPGLHPQRCGLYGVSFGAYLAPAAAALAGPGVRACAAVGGCYSLKTPDWERLPPLIQADFAHFCGAGDERSGAADAGAAAAADAGAADAPAAAVAGQVSLERRLAGLTCPLLLFHGDADAIFPPDHAERTAAAARRAGAAVEVHILAGGNHVCNNLPHHYRPYVADWLADKLTA